MGLIKTVAFAQICPLSLPFVVLRVCWLTIVVYRIGSRQIKAGRRHVITSASGRKKRPSETWWAAATTAESHSSVLLGNGELMLAGLAVAGGRCERVTLKTVDLAPALFIYLHFSPAPRASARPRIDIRLLSRVLCICASREKL